MNGLLSQREHARLARDLIDACGGLDEATRNCRVCKSVLSTYQSPAEPTSMAGDVIDALEIYCGKPIYSRALFERFDAAKTVGDIGSLACDLSEAAVQLQALIRRAIADGKVTPRELDIIAKAEGDASDALDRLRGVRRAADTMGMTLKAI